MIRVRQARMRMFRTSYEKGEDGLDDIRVE
jgi:hypothetical protein